MRKVTIEDISRDTGLSRGTVSRALNDRPDISAATKQRVLEACRKLNYIPSHAARSLATGRNYAVAALVEDLRSPFVASFLRGVLNRAEESHYAVHVIEIGAAPDAQRLHALSPERIDGALNVVALPADTAHHLHTVLESRPLASCCALDGVSCDVYSPDYAEAGRLAARFLVRNGLRELLFVHLTGNPIAEALLTGFQEVCRESGIDPETATAEYDDESSLDALAPRLERARGIVAASDSVAISVLVRMAAMNHTAGRDYALLGFGDDPAGARIRPSLTTVDFDAAEIGRRAMESVLGRVGHERSESGQQVRVAPVLIERDSTSHLS